MSGDAIELTGEQQAAIDMVVEGGHRTCCLTGPPGTGKSTTIRELVRRLRAQGRTLALAAPSGKAALRLQEAAGFPASTIHRLLFLQPGRVTEPRPLLFEVVVIDESSMCDAELLGEVVRSCEAGTVRTLLLVGDADQLPPVGAGCPFLDLLASGQVPTTRLTQIQRQAEKSGIIRAAHAIRAGRCPDWAPDFELLEVPEADRIPDVVHRFLLAEEWSPDDTLILAPKHDGPCGVKALCDRLERAQTPAVATPVLLRGLFRKGTRVIQTANNYEFGVFNGELGWVEKVVEGKKRSEDEVVVAFAGRPPCGYRGGEIGQLLPAWALTVHRSQGSEARNVVVVAHKGHAFMLTRSLLYVAVTRAKERVVVVGDSRAVEQAVRTVRDQKRSTMLSRLFKTDRDAAGKADVA